VTQANAGAEPGKPAEAATSNPPRRRRRSGHGKAGRQNADQGSSTRPASNAEQRDIVTDLAQSA
jgi:hypothetical protein